MRSPRAAQAGNGGFCSFEFRARSTGASRDAWFLDAAGNEVRTTSHVRARATYRNADTGMVLYETSRCVSTVDPARKLFRLQGADRRITTADGRTVFS